MEKSNPGIWIGAAIAVAVIVVAMTVQRKSGPSEPPATADRVTGKTTTSPAHAPAPNPASPPRPSPVVAQTPSDPAPRSNPSPATVPPSLDPDDIPRVEPKAALPPATRENVRQAIDDLDIVIRNFRTTLGGNPVGTNAEITSALLGNNLKQVKLHLPDNSQVNGEGELCDIWGTPYFFHQESGTRMEIRSAGPDRKLWTGDDVLK